MAEDKYIKVYASDDIFDKINDIAETKGISAGEYLLGLHAAGEPNKYPIRRSGKVSKYLKRRAVNRAQRR